MSLASDEAQIYEGFVGAWPRRSWLWRASSAEGGRSPGAVEAAELAKAQDRTGNYNLRSAVRLGRTNNVILPSFGEAVVQEAAEAGVEVNSELLGEVMTHCLRHKLYQVTGMARCCLPFAAKSCCCGWG